MLKLEKISPLNLKIDAKISATVLVLMCDVVFSVILLFATYGEIQLQAAEKKSPAVTADTLGSCHVSCLIDGKTFHPSAVKCLADLTFEHCKRLETEDVTLYCPKEIGPSKLMAQFSVRSCN